MHPILFQYHHLTIYSYGFAVAIAMLLSLFLAERRATSFGFDKTLVADALFALFIFGILGARLLYVGLNWSEYQGDFWGIFRIQEGGLVWYGGLFGAMIFGALYARFRNWPILKLCDFFSPMAAMAHGIGRLGCFLNGCCYGRRTDSIFGVHFPDDTYAKIPTQLYEALALFFIAGYLFLRSSKPYREGGLFFRYLILYALLRFALEFWRGDNTHYLSLTLPQWMSIGLFASASAILFFRMEKK